MKRLSDGMKRLLPSSPRTEVGGTCVLVVCSPECAELGDGTKALVLRGRRSGSFAYGGETLHGRGYHLRVGLLSQGAAEWTIEGNRSSMRIRSAIDSICQLDLDFGKASLANPVNVWGTIQKPEWAQRFALHADGTLGPAALHELVLGVCAQDDDPHLRRVVLVHRDDVSHRLVFSSPPEALEQHRAAEAELAARAAPPNLPGKQTTVMILKSPPCTWLGAGRKALVVEGAPYGHEFSHGGSTMHGRGQQLRNGPV